MQEKSLPRQRHQPVLPSEVKLCYTILNMAVPKFLQSALWSYDVHMLNPQRNKRYIIEQIFNHGTWPQLQWLLRTYSTRELKHIFLTPSRGIWHADVLNYWENIWNIRIPRMTRERALFSLEPKFLPLPHATRKTS